MVSVAVTVVGVDDDGVVVDSTIDGMVGVGVGVDCIGNGCACGGVDGDGMRMCDTGYVGSVVDGGVADVVVRVGVTVVVVYDSVCVVLVANVSDVDADVDAGVDTADIVDGGVAVSAAVGVTVDGVIGGDSNCWICVHGDVDFGGC